MFLRKINYLVDCAKLSQDEIARLKNAGYKEIKETHTKEKAKQSAQSERSQESEVKNENKETNAQSPQT